MVHSNLKTQHIPTIDKIRLNKISKRFPSGLLANQDITIEARAGEVHAILGENGAGKTTVMKILAGLIQPTSGNIEINGKICKFTTPQKAKRAGIGMVHQHFSLVSALTVSENLALSELKGGLFVRQKNWRNVILKEAEQAGFDIRPDEPVWKLSLGEQQRVEIFRLVLARAKILILDEPTSILAPQESEILFRHIRQFAENGHIIFLVTHKIHHVRAIADTVSVLRQGRLIKTAKADDLSDDELADLMVGRHLKKSSTRKTFANALGDMSNLVEVKNLNVAPSKSIHGLHNVSFSIKAGEVFGVSGISGNGQNELSDAIMGIAPFKGSINIDGKNHEEGTVLGPKIAYIPADRRGVGLAESLTLMENLSMRIYDEKPFSSIGILNRSKLREYALQKIHEYNINPQNPDAIVRHFSGGNMQKALLARELEGKPSLVLAINPTAGLDLTTVKMVHAKLVEKAEQGSAVLIISEDLDELFELCDRVMVLREGKVQGIREPQTTTKIEMGLMMSNDKNHRSERAHVKSSFKLNNSMVNAQETTHLKFASQVLTIANPTMDQNS